MNYPAYAENAVIGEDDGNFRVSYYEKCPYCGRVRNDSKIMHLGRGNKNTVYATCCCGKGFQITIGRIG